ncbi:unnamed protein product [Didymodactylos carnosus]|uniref:Uncharacterized protein n=1 Tax=Didymodactylos carnosus TaxID=1234261 RepID=A0A815ZDF5_9BILA|nr:unnamed protein product [Didymodactylos carnosus]CAF1583599.1 unnamed protein product [Didymodactylos carnosus]CAF4315629.1 unnamed protein product [Didymodactylos carnosus]CAF4451975.1 unnamed protein product [Didymodactylos carnosus]
MAFKQHNRTLSNSSNDDADSIDRRKAARYREKLNADYDNPRLRRIDDPTLLMIEANSASESEHEDENEEDSFSICFKFQKVIRGPIYTGKVLEN